MKKKKKRIYIHYGASQFEPSKFEAIKNYPDPYVKPDHKTGMWASPVKSKYGWKDWCLQEEFNLDKLNISFKFVLKPGARIAHVRNVTDLMKLPQRAKTDYLYGYQYGYNIDFEHLALLYDAIELHLTEDPDGVRGSLYYLLYGWDCDSILILNPDVVEEV